MSSHLLRERREALRLTQAALAAKLGTSKFVLSRIESGGTLPTLPLAARIERELGIPASSWVPVETAA